MKQKQNEWIIGGFLFTFLSLVIIIASTVVAQNSSSNNAESNDPFYTILEVIKSPRCMNCHPTDNQPRQTDTQYPHLFGVIRGEDNHGGVVLKCASCHHLENNPYSNVPGARHWGVAPRTMGWLGLSDAEIAQTLVDPIKNGGRDAEALVHHMSHDALVLWAWNAGDGREPPPVNFDDFVIALNEWLEQGAELPIEFQPEAFQPETTSNEEGVDNGN